MKPRRRALQRRDRARAPAATRDGAVSATPRMSNCTIAEWRSAEICVGDARRAASARRSPAAARRTAPSTRRSSRAEGRVATVAASAPHEHGLAGVVVEAGVVRAPARRAPVRRWTARCRSASRSRRPGPAITATTTNASQPKVAVFQCAALQRAARSAMISSHFQPLSRSDQLYGEPVIRAARRQRGVPASRAWG